MPIDLLAQPADVLRALRTVMGGSRMEPVAEVVRRLRATGLRLPAGSDAEEMVLDVVDSSASLWALGPDLEVLNLAQLMSGRVLTHRLSTAEVADGILQVSIDFPGYAFEHLATSGLTMPTGQVLDLFDRPGGPLDAPLAFTLPEGSCDELGLGVGALAGIAFDAGVARLVAVGDVGDPGALAQDLAAALADARIVEIDEPFELLLATTEHFREPLAPVTEILAEYGFGRDGEFIAATPQVLAEDELADQREGVARAFDLGPDEAAVVVGAVWYARALQTALNAQVPAEDVGDGDTDAEPRWVSDRMAALQAAVAVAPVRMLEIRDGLADPWLAFAIGDQALSRDEPCPDGLGLLCEALAESVAAPPRKSHRAGLEYLTGRCREDAGDPQAAERHFQRAISLDPEHSYAMLGLAGIAADRGQYEAAQSLLDRAGADERHPLRSALQLALGSTTAPQRLPGRNEPCWCGSGRKFKACHARVSTSPLPARARSLLGRALAWHAVTDSGSSHRLLRLGLMVSGDPASVDALIALVPDVLLFEGGGMADYLDRRADLIPDGEAMLIQQWLLRPRSLYEVEVVRPGEGMTLRAVMTGDRVDVRERSASAELAVGNLILTRVANIGDHDEIFGGGTVVSFGERDQVIALLSGEPDPFDIIRFVARRYLPPEVRTPEGDSLESVEGTYTTTTPAQLRRALDARLDSAGDGVWHLLEDGFGGGQRVLGTVELAGRTLTASAISVPRYERLLEVLDELDVPLVEKAREVRRLDEGPPASADAGAAVATGSGAPAGGLLKHRGIGTSSDASGPFLSPNEIAQDPEMLAHMSAYIAEYERTWCDEPVPALGGVTPRQAAADPTRRGDLIALLSSFPSAGSSLQMDGGRLKKALGLDGDRG